jgi:hypothetical protein
VDPDGDLDKLLASFLAGDSEARNELPERIGSEFHAKAHRFCDARMRGLDLAEDVAQRAWELLLRRSPASFKPDRGTAWKFLEGVLMDAARDIRAAHVPPGFRTRDTSAISLSIDAQSVSTSKAAVADGEYEDVVSAAGLSCILQHCFGDAEPWLVEAATAIASLDDTIARAARRYGRNRLAVRRGLDRRAACVRQHLVA